MLQILSSRRKSQIPDETWVSIHFLQAPPQHTAHQMLGHALLSQQPLHRTADPLSDTKLYLSLLLYAAFSDDRQSSAESLLFPAWLIPRREGEARNFLSRTRDVKEGRPFLPGTGGRQGGGSLGATCFSKALGTSLLSSDRLLLMRSRRRFSMI